MPARPLPLGGRTLVMGVINVTPDSFWPGSRFSDVFSAVTAARTFVAEGADILDIGGQSTHPRAPQIPAAEEMERLLPALRAVRSAVDCLISVDTFYAEVAEAAVAAGADLVNDVSGLAADPAMAATVARLGVPAILMDRERLARDADVVATVCTHLEAILARAERAGIPRQRVVLDPGFGFGKVSWQSLALIRGLPRLSALGQPLCVAVSRKGTIGRVLGGLPVEERLEGSLALGALCAAAGVAILRAHDVRATVRTVRMVEAALAGSRWGPPTAGPRDEIRLEGIAVEATHGVLPEEHRHPQPFRADVVLRGEYAAAGRSDDLRQTIDYGAVAAEVVAVLSGPRRDLIESLAESVAARLLAAFPAREVEVVVHKPRAPVGVPLADVSVCVRRSR